jgi:uncharacterized protein YbjT (DUF2867 family)
MRIFVAGATGVLGARLVPLLVERGHEVTGMTRSAEKAEVIRGMGAEPIVCDVFDADGVARAIGAAAPDMIVDELTDLPDSQSEIPSFRPRNDRVRTEGLRNLLAAADGARVVSQSIAWEHPDEQARAAVEEHEALVLGAGGTVVRYGQLYGPGTYYPEEVPSPPRIHVDDAARRTLDALDAPPGIVLLTDES